MKGFTLIELMIALAVILILGVTLSGVVGSTNSSVSFGVNGITEMRCINGYMFVIGNGGQARQVLDESGKGAKCGG